MRKFMLATTALLLGLGALAACGAAEQTRSTEAEAPQSEPAPASSAPDSEIKLAKAGTYILDPAHTSVVFSVSRFGLSNYTARFPGVQATLVWDPQDASATSLTATIETASVATNYVGDYKASHADSGYDSWDAQLGRDAKWLDGDAHPTITFVSTSVTPTGPDTGTVTGDLTFRGITKPVTLDVTYNGVANFPWAPEQDKIGFSATATLNREDFGLSTFAPNIGSNVEIRIETEFAEVME